MLKQRPKEAVFAQGHDSHIQGQDKEPGSHGRPGEEKPGTSEQGGGAGGGGEGGVLALSCKPLSKQALFLHTLPRVRAGWKHW